MNHTSAGRLVVLSAPSGAGKTTLARKVIAQLAEQGVQARFSVSYTTRAPRPGEKDGRDYHFVDRAAFDAMAAAGELLEHAEVFGRCYGTGREKSEAAMAAGEVLFLDIDWQGARQIRERMGGRGVSVFILPPSLAVLHQRLVGRGQDSDEIIQGRMEQARSEMSHFDEFDFVIVNDDLERAAAQLRAICLGEELAGSRASDHAVLIKSLLE